MFVKLKTCFFNKTIRLLYRFKTQETQTGQGLVEYLLILVLTVSIISAVMNGVGKPLASYMSNIYKLVGCMLRVGEGPNIAFNLCGGWPSLELNKDALNAVGSIGGSNSGGDGSDDNTNNSNSSESNQSSNITTPSNRRSIDGSGNRNGGNSNFGDSTDPNQPNKIKIEGDKPGDGDSFNYSGSNQKTVIIRRIRRSGGGQIDGGLTLVDKEKAINSGETGTVTPSPIKKKIPEKLRVNGKKVSSFTISSNNGQSDGAELYKENNSFSFIKMVKWAIIIAIIFIFGAFTLSQLNSIRKGWTD